MAIPIAAILAAVAKGTGAGMKGAGEYLQGKSSSSPASDNSDNSDNSNNSIIGKIIAEKSAGNAMGKAGGTGATGTAGMSAGASAGAGAGAAGSAGAAAGASAGAGAAGAAGGAGAAAAAASDERLKRVCGDNADLINLFSKIGSYEFNYNDKAKALNPNGENHVDNKRHVGVMAQELEKNPATNAVINTDKNGYKAVDTAQLTLTNTAVLADVCRRLEALEKQLGI